jgi:hypothetical protein
VNRIAKHMNGNGNGNGHGIATLAPNERKAKKPKNTERTPMSGEFSSDNRRFSALVNMLLLAGAAGITRGDLHTRLSRPGNLGPMIDALVNIGGVTSVKSDRRGTRPGRKPVLITATPNLLKLAKTVDTSAFVGDGKREEAKEKATETPKVASKKGPAKITNIQMVKGVKKSAIKTARYAIGLDKLRSKLPHGAQAALKKAVTTLKLKLLSSPSSLVVDDERVMWLAWAYMSVDSMRHIVANHNEHNRAVGINRATKYAERMRGPDWMLNGATVVFSDTPDLIDGQNRIKAAIAVGEPLVAPVCIGVKHAAFATLDDVFVRTVVHRLQTAGRPFPSVRASALLLLHRLERSALDNCDHITEMLGVRLDGMSALDLDAHYSEDLDPALDFVMGVRWGIGAQALPKHVAAFALVILSRISQATARNFIRLIAEGGANHSSPIFYVRERLMKAAQQRLSPAETKKKAAKQISLLMLAWNSYCFGKQKRTAGFTAGDMSVAEYILKRLAEPSQRILEEAVEKTPETMVKAIMERARAIKERNLEAMRTQTTDRDGANVMRIKCNLESS